MIGTSDIQPLVNGGPGQLSESPLWCGRSGRLWWVDVVGARLHAFTPSSGQHDIYQAPGRFSGCCLLRANGDLVVAVDQTLHAFDSSTGTFTPLVAPEPHLGANRLNDGKIDRQGRIWIGTMNASVFEPHGSLYRVVPDLTVTKQFGEIIIPNSIAFSPDDRTFYFADTRAMTIWAFDFDVGDGRLSNRRVFSDTRAHPGRPDGATVDAEGFLWSAEIMGARLVRYAPDGRIDRVIALPIDRPTSCAFGGDGLATLFVTSMSIGLSDQQLLAQPCAAGLFALDVGVRGLPEPRFAG